jgi:hypothetical protein
MEYDRMKKKCSCSLHIKIFLLVVLFLSSLVEVCAQHSALYINEFMASNVLAYENTNGDYEDWIEIYNSGGSAIDLAGYYMTDNIAGSSHWRIPSGQPAKTTIPAKGYLVLYADESAAIGSDHLDFKLSSTKGEIGLIGTDGVAVLDSISYVAQFRDISYGRSPDGGNQWGYLTDFTPGAANKIGFPAFALPPSIDQAAGFYPSVNVSAQPAAIGDTIRYTLDGSDPTQASPRYTAPVGIAQTSMFKARSFVSGKLASQFATKAFLMTGHDLPVLALITDPKNLFDPATGIYVNDKDGRAWERFGELEYFRNQSLTFYMPAGLRIQGNTGPKDYNKKSFRAYFRTGYGKERLVCQLYPESPVTSFSRIVFRAGSDDSMEPTVSKENEKATLLRDPLVTELWRRTGSLTPNSSFAVLYMNNTYNGIYDIKESLDEHFVCDHMAYKDVDIIRTRWDSLETVYGDRTKWNELVSFFQNNSFAGDEKIVEVSQFFDLDNFTNLQALVHSTEYMTWAYGVFMFREKSAAGRWQWTIWDADRSYTDVNWNGFVSQYNPIGTYLDNLITKKLLQNQSYKIKYINRIADLLNTTFCSDSMKSIINSLAQHIQSEVPAEAAKWNNTVAKWSENVNNMRSFAEQRPSIVRQQMQDYFNLSGQAIMAVQISGKGKIKINTITINQSSWSGKYFRNIPVAVTAIPDPGYRFAGWTNASLPSSETITVNLAGDTTVSALFTPIGNANAELIAPKRIKTGQHLPFVVRIRTASGEINPIEQTPMNITFGGGHADSVIAIKRGAGTGVVQINTTSPFTLSVQNANVPAVQKQIEISSVPSISYSGTLSTGDIVWDNTADRLITADVTIPAGCHLTIQQGTCVLIKKYVNFHVAGELTVQGTADEPVLITSDNWSEPWGGMDFDNTTATFEYCMVLNGGGDLSKGQPTNEGWHTGYQHMFFAKGNSELTFNQCFFLYSPGKVIGAQDSKVTLRNSVTSFVRHGGEFHRVLLSYKDSHLLNLPNDDYNYIEDIDTDGLHIDYVNPNFPQYSVIDHCYFVTGKDDAIDHHNSRLKISNCWLEDFTHEGVAASGGDTVRIYNTLALNNDQGFEGGNTDGGVSKGPFVFIDHCVAVGNNVGIRIGDSYASTYKDVVIATNSIVYNNKNNIWNFLFSTNAPLPGALDISYSMTNDSDYNASPYCITGVPQFDPYYYLLPGSPGVNRGMRGTNMGRADSTAMTIGSIVINEIMYNPPSGMDSKDWIELYNSQSVDQDISGWIIKDEVDANAFVIPSGSIPAKGYRLLCGDTVAFKQVYPSVNAFSGNIPFGFGGKDQVRLFTPQGQLVDSVAYDNNSPWPPEADGNGYTLILLDPAKDHTLPANWSRSGQFGGSPGIQNLTTGVEEPSELTLPTEFVLEQNFPNPFNSSTTIRFSLPRESHVELEIFDLLGRRVGTIFSGQLPQGRYSMTWKPENVSSGMFLYRIRAGNFVSVKKLLLIK